MTSDGIKWIYELLD